jgi:hypothetical protein
VISNITYILQLRFLALRGRRIHSRLVPVVAGFDAVHKNWLCRSAVVASGDHFVHILAFLKLQIRGFTSAVSGDAAVYQLGQGFNVYIGQTSLVRRSAAIGCSGPCRRFSEHLRELNRHMLGTVSDSHFRNRYRVLAAGLRTPMLGLVILTLVSSRDVLSHESARIGLAMPGANGYHCKHLAEVCRLGRRGRSRGSGGMTRVSMGSRRRAYAGRACQVDGAWGADTLSWVVSMQERRLVRLLNAYEKSGRRKVHLHEMQATLSLSFGDLYFRRLRRHCAVFGCGPVDMYSRNETALLLKRAAQIRFCSAIQWQRAIDNRGQTADFMFVLLSFCFLLTCYRDKIRAETSIKTALKQVGILVPQMLAFSVPFPAWKRDARSWCRILLRQHARAWPLRTGFLLQHMRVVVKPPAS